MKRMTLPLYLCAALFVSTVLNTNAATHIVLPNTSIQAKINAAASGDTIIVKGGTYSGEALNIDNKLLDIRPAQGESVIITEGVTLQNLMGTFNFANFRIGGDNTKNLNVNNCTKVYLDNLDLSTSGGGLSVNTHTFVQSNNCTFGTNLTIDNNSTFYGHSTTWAGYVLTTNSKITLRKCTVSGTFTANKSSVNLLKSTVHQSFACNHTRTTMDVRWIA